MQKINSLILGALIAVGFTGTSVLILNAFQNINKVSTDDPLSLSLINEVIDKVNSINYTGGMLESSGIIKYTEDTTATCDVSKEGAIVYSGGKFVGCDGTQWNEFSVGSMVEDGGGNDAYTVLMMSFEDSSLSDESISNHSATAYGNASVNASGKFDNAYLLDGSGDYISLADSDDWSFEDQDYTIDFWVNFVQVPTRGGIVEQYRPNQSTPTASRGWGFAYSAGSLTYFTYPSGCGYFSYSWTPTTNTWYHVSVVRNGKYLYFFVDGNIVSSTTLTSCTMNNPNQPLQIGIDYDSSHSAYYSNIMIDELRVSKSVARWTSNFTPPTGPYN